MACGYVIRNGPKTSAIEMDRRDFQRGRLVFYNINIYTHTQELQQSEEPTATYNKHNMEDPRGCR